MFLNERETNKSFYDLSYYCYSGCSKTTYFKADLEVQQLIEAVGKTSNNPERAAISMDPLPGYNPFRTTDNFFPICCSYRKRCKIPNQILIRHLQEYWKT